MKINSAQDTGKSTSTIGYSLVSICNNIMVRGRPSQLHVLLDWQVEEIQCMNENMQLNH